MRLVRAALLTLLLSIVVASGRAEAQTCPNAGHAGVVECPSGEAPLPVAPPAQVGGRTAERGSALPFTGTDVVQLLVLGGMALGVGVVLVSQSRRHRHLV